MSGLVEHVERAEIARWEAVLVEEPRCASRSHADPTFHGGPAAYWQIGPCVHSTGLRCASVVGSYIPWLPIMCGVCENVSAYENYRWIEL